MFLDLYRAIEDYKRISKDKEIINNHYSYFRGFDGNNEGQYMQFARFLINKQNKFSEQKDYLRKNDNLNSHTPMVSTYEKMLSKWEDIGKPWNLNAQHINDIFNI